MLDSNKTELENMRKQLPTWFPSSGSDGPSQWQLFEGDMSKKDDIEQAADSASTFFDGHLDVLVNNAAITGAIHDTKIDQEDFLALWENSIKVNLTGSMLMSRACLPLLKKTSTRQQGGSIIMMSSTRAYQSELNSEAYASTKAGLLGLSQALSCSLAEDNVSCNAILPGWINVAHESREGDENGTKWEDGLTEDDQRWHFSGRVGKVEDILKAVEYFSEAGSFVTGQEIKVDGGVTRRMTYPE